MSDVVKLKYTIFILVNNMTFLILVVISLFFPPFWAVTIGYVVLRLIITWFVNSSTRQLSKLDRETQEAFEYLLMMKETVFARIDEYDLDDLRLYISGIEQEDVKWFETLEYLHYKGFTAILKDFNRSMNTDFPEYTAIMQHSLGKIALQVTKDIDDMAYVRCVPYHRFIG